MSNYTYIERYFLSERALTDIRESHSRTLNTLFLYLENLHSIRDLLLKDFNHDISNSAEFKILRILRNYFHHHQELKDNRVGVYNQSSQSYIASHSHGEMILVPTLYFAQSIKHFLGTKNSNYVEREFESIRCIYDIDCILSVIDHLIQDKGIMTVGERTFEHAHDIFKFVFNITNIIADFCRDNEILNEMECVKLLDPTFTQRNNIEKNNMSSYANDMSRIYLSMEGYLYI